MRSLLLALACCAVASADHVVLRDGAILDGDVSRSGDTVAVGGRSVALEDVLLWEDDDKTARHVGTPRDHYRGVRALAERETLAACLALLPQAVEKRDAKAARAILERADRAGLDPKEAERWEARVDKLSGGDDSGLKAPGQETLVAMLLERAEGLLDKDRTWALHLLRYALLADPGSEPALAMLEEEAPRRWRLGDARNWLDWQIRCFSTARKLPRRSPDLARAKLLWQRKDLVGLETRNVILITPLPDPEPIRMCIELGDLTCRALDAMFKVDEPKRDEFLPLVVYFYENRAEYVAKGGRGNPSIALTAGFYVPTENVSRFFWPAHPAQQAGVRDTFVHELTHHWIERRNPRWHERDLASIGERTGIPGYWIAEGFATFIQHSRFDRAKGTWTFFNPKAHTLDVVAAVAKDKKLLDWNMVYTLTQAKFHGELTKTAVKGHAQVKGRWTIWPHPISKVRLFYEQASATCMFLYWGENGKYREQLLDYVTNFYTSRKDNTSTQAAFGLDEATLGAKVADFAIHVIDKGFRPDLGQGR